LAVVLLALTVAVNLGGQALLRANATRRALRGGEPR